MIFVCVLLTYLLFHSLLDLGAPEAATFAAYLGLFTLATARICFRQKRFPRSAVPLGLLCLALSLSFLLHGDCDLQWVLFLLLIPLSGFYCLVLTGANLHPFGSFYVLLDLLHCEVFLPIRHLFAPFTDAFEALQHRRAEHQASNKRRAWLPVAIGLLAAVPILLLVVPLLIDADAAFASVAGGLYQTVLDALRSFGDWLEQMLPFDGFALVLSLLFAPYIYAVIYAFSNGTAKAENRNTAARFVGLQRVSPVFMTTVLGVICGVYVIYLLSQTGYLFSAFSGHLPFGGTMSVTEYARRGFFELCKLAGVNFVLLALSVGVTRRKNGRITPAIKGLDFFLCCFTMLLCAISMAKILLYIRTFGLTEKRLCVFAADIVLLVVLLAILLRLRFRRFPYMAVMLGALFTVTAALGLLGVGNTLAWYNTNGMLNGSLREMTPQEIWQESGYAALQYLQRIANGENRFSADAQRTLTDAVAYDGIELDSAEPFLNLEYNRYLQFAKEQLRQAESLQIVVDFDLQMPVYALEYTCRLNGKDVLGGGMTHADQSPLENRTVLTFDRRDLPENVDLAQLELQFSLCLSPDDASSDVVSVKNEGDSMLEGIGFGKVCRVLITQLEDGAFVAW